MLGLKTAKTYIEILQESYTAVLQANGLHSDEDCQKLLNPVMVDAGSQTENEIDITENDVDENLIGEEVILADASVIKSL